MTCAACDYTDNGYCTCDCHTDRPVIGERSVGERNTDRPIISTERKRWAKTTGSPGHATTGAIAVSATAAAQTKTTRTTAPNS